MSYVSVEAAKNSCVPQEQNELVVQTGLTFQIPKLNVESLIGNMIYFIGDTNKTRSLPLKLQQLFQKYCHEHHIKEKPSSFHPIGTILDIPQEYRSKSIIICFDEPSYNGRQCLYHLFGGNIPELSQGKGKPYQAFSELIDRVQNENTAAIVFVPKALQNDTLKPVMWCPTTIEEPKKVVKPLRFPKTEIEYFFRNTNITGYDVVSIPPTIRSWLGKNYPNTNFVKLDSEDRILYTFRGWNEAPTSIHQKCPDWETTVKVLPDEPKFPKADVDAFYKNMDKYIEFSTVPNTLAYPVDILSESMKIWVQTNYPETTYVNLGHMHDYSKNRMMFIMWGWNQKPINFNDRCNPDWRTPYETVNEEEPKKVVEPPKFPKTEIDEIYFNIPVEGGVSSRPRVAGQHVNELPKSIQSWVKAHYPETGYVMFGPDSTLYGLKDYLFSPRLTDFQWQTTFQILPYEPKFPKSVPTTQDPVQAQLAALTEAVTNLTRVIAEKMK